MGIVYEIQRLRENQWIKSIRKSIPLCKIIVPIYRLQSLLWREIFS